VNGTATVTVIVPKKDESELKMDFARPASLYGPLASAQTVGHVIGRNHGEVVATFGLVLVVLALIRSRRSALVALALAPTSRPRTGSPPRPALRILQLPPRERSL